MYKTGKGHPPTSLKEITEVLLEQLGVARVGGPFLCFVGPRIQRKSSLKHSRPGEVRARGVVALGVLVLFWIVR